MIGIKTITRISDEELFESVKYIFGIVRLSISFIFFLHLSQWILLTYYVVFRSFVSLFIKCVDMIPILQLLKAKFCTKFLSIFLSLFSIYTYLPSFFFLRSLSLYDSADKNKTWVKIEPESLHFEICSVRVRSFSTALCALLVLLACMLHLSVEPFSWGLTVVIKIPMKFVISLVLC